MASAYTTFVKGVPAYHQANNIRKNAVVKLTKIFLNLVAPFPSFTPCVATSGRGGHPTSTTQKAKS